MPVVGEGRHREVSPYPDPCLLGIVAMLEVRGRSTYLGMIRTVLDAARIKIGETVLDIGLRLRRRHSRDRTPDRRP
jgi:hypothetical protein